MADEQSYIIPHRDLAQIIREQNAGAIEEFLKDPFSAIAGAVNELLLHPTAMASTAVRVAHSALKGKLFEQFAKEVRDLREKGKLPDSFADKKNGYSTWVDLLKIIDDECPDEDRLEALKAMFFAANKINADDEERIAAYELFQIAKTLSSSELLVLMGLWRLTRQENRGTYTGEDLKQASRLRYEELIVAVMHSLRTKTLVGDTHLTSVGDEFCKNIKQYRTETEN